jgi:uncharacterized protein YndB with AHSA1/START domain
MTTDKTLKRRVRERMAETGERYAAARSQVIRKRDRITAATERLSADEDRPSDEAVVAATGKAWDAWFASLDAWGAGTRTHTQTATHLREDLGVPGWWAQSITVSYQRARGLRLKHQHADGFTVSASRTVGVPIADAFDAFTQPRRRDLWLTDGTARLRTSRLDHPVAWTARFDWGDGPSRLLVTFEDKGPAKTTLTVTHERLADPDEAEEAKLAWRQRLGSLKAYLEA